MKRLDANFNRVIVKEVEPEKVTKGGLVIPDTATEKPNKGVVTSSCSLLNQNNEVTPNPIKEGDVVYYGKYAGTEIEFEGETYKVIDFKDILATEVDIEA